MVAALNWNTKLAVMVNGNLVSPIESFSPTLNVGHRVQHSLEADNVGIVTQAQTFTFTMTIRAVGAAVATLTQLALAGTQFAIVLTEQTGSDWTFKTIAFNSCYFTSISPSNVMLDDSPTATFSGVCLDVEPTT
ncbi:MAG: hypothetical protein JOY71_01845 [Acetobacteraceae bacterium]|nr:hypothetical protein [Acetobacteraceae bacterium]